MPESKSRLLRHVQKLNAWNPRHFHPFFISGQHVGYLKEFMYQALDRWPGYFIKTEKRVDFADEFGFKERNRILDEVSQELAQLGVITHYLGEIYPVTANDRNNPAARLDRGSAAYFGIRTYGQHLNGYVMTETGIKLWIARRADDRIHFPNRLDNMVAGGLPDKLSLKSNLLKECREEANVPVELVSRAISTGTVSYCCETEAGLKPDTLYCYDLELPADFKPENTDGEVAEFMLLDVDEVRRLVLETDKFKPNCNLVILDFLVRHGAIDPEDSDYLELVASLHT